MRYYKSGLTKMDPEKSDLIQCQALQQLASEGKNNSKRLAEINYLLEKTNALLEHQPDIV